MVVHKYIDMGYLTDLKDLTGIIIRNDDSMLVTVTDREKARSTCRIVLGRGSGRVWRCD